MLGMEKSTYWTCAPSSRAILLEIQEKHRDARADLHEVQEMLAVLLELRCAFSFVLQGRNPKQLKLISNQQQGSRTVSESGGKGDQECRSFIILDLL